MSRLLLHSSPLAGWFVPISFVSSGFFTTPDSHFGVPLICNDIDSDHNQICKHIISNLFH